MGCIMHIVKYTESERGWGGEVWYTEFSTKELADESVTDYNKDLPTSYVPDYYIKAEYIGEMTELPKGYKL